MAFTSKSHKISLPLHKIALGLIGMALCFTTKSIPSYGLSLLPTASKTQAALQERQLRTDRLAHARELLGKSFKSKVMIDQQEFKSFIYAKTRESLPKKWKIKATSIAQTILEESSKHHFDPVFLMAVMQHESRFRPDAKGEAGEIGLMQVMPATGAWMAKKIGLKWRGSKTLNDPKANIQIGSAFLAELRERFDAQGQLYLAAYNMGAKNVERNLDDDVRPTLYPHLVMKQYLQIYKSLKEKHKYRPILAKQRTLAAKEDQSLKTDFVGPQEPLKELLQKFKQN